MSLFSIGFSRLSLLGMLGAGLLPLGAYPQGSAAAPHPRRNVIIFVADGLRRGSVTEAHMPTFWRVRREGVDFHNSHSVFPTFTTANASVIATGHALGDTGDFSNVIYPGRFVAPMATPNGSSGTVTPFLESDEVLADMNSFFNGNYLGERTLLSVAREHNFNVASIGKVGPTAIQQIEALQWDQEAFADTPAIIIDDQTGRPTGVPLPVEIADAIGAAELPPAAPTRSNAYPDDSPWSNGNFGDSMTAGTKAANVTQQQWFTEIATRVLLPRFAASERPFVLLFWSRDPDGTQHNNGDSFNAGAARYGLQPGINGETSLKALHNADNCLNQLLAWLDAHPDVKANTDVLLTSDHGFATISRRELDTRGTLSASPAKTPENEPVGKEKPQPAGNLPAGFLAMDLALSTNARLFDSAVPGSTGDSVFSEVLFRTRSPRPHPSNGSAILGMPNGKPVRTMDASDAQMIVASNGGSDLIYVPSGDAKIVQAAVEALTTYDYVSGIFVDNRYCPEVTSCPGALRLSDIDLDGASKLPKPAIVVNFSVFYPSPDLQSAIQVSDTTLQEGQGMHGGFGRESTWNNMAAIGPDFRQGFVDEAPVGNIDIAPTVASLLGIELPSVGKLHGRVMSEALLANTSKTVSAPQAPVVSSPAKNGRRTVVQFQKHEGVRYLDRGCMVSAAAKPDCGL